MLAVCESSTGEPRGGARVPTLFLGLLDAFRVEKYYFQGRPHWMRSE